MQTPNIFSVELVKFLFKRYNFNVMNMERKALLFINDCNESKDAVRIFDKAGLTYVTYHIKNFEDGCCGEIPITVVPSVFAPEGIFKGLEGIKYYISIRNNSKSKTELSESAYW